MGLHSSLRRYQMGAAKASSINHRCSPNRVSPPAQEDGRDQGSRGQLSTEWGNAAEELGEKTKVSKVATWQYSNSSNFGLLAKSGILLCFPHLLLQQEEESASETDFRKLARLEKMWRKSHFKKLFVSKWPFCLVHLHALRKFYYYRSAVIRLCLKVPFKFLR